MADHEASTLNELGTTQKQDQAKRIAECVTELLARKARFNIPDGDGLFALEVAAKYGLEDQAAQLIEAGTTPSLSSDQERFAETRR